MTFDTNLLIGLFAGLIVMWVLDWWLYGREGGARQAREIEDLRQELAVYKKARTTAEANLQTVEGEAEALRGRLHEAELAAGACRDKLTAAEAELAGLREQVEELSTADAREAAAVIPAAPAPGKIDDLKAIEGIGPKIEEVLHAAGIKTFAQLAGSSVASLERIVRDEAGIKVAYPDTWPQQAGLAAAGKWEELERLQDNLRGGRRVQ